MALSNEVTRFKQWLRDKGTTEDVLKVCAVVETNLGEIAQTTHAGGQRTRVITPMIREGMSQPLPEDSPVAAGDPADIGWDRLTRLEVGPFRGFRRQEVFDLGHPTVLILGANGTGKSSICEAIELALLGRIEEADERALEPRRYLDNAHEGRHERPVLMARLNGKDQELHPDEERHRFVIVERNRIESFARIGARKPAEATGMLAALFGLSDFHDFVSGFGASLDTRLRLTLPKAAELEQKRAAIQADQAKIASVEDTHAALDLQRQQVAEAFEAGLTYADLKARIGTPEVPGRLQAIRAVLAVPLPPVSGIRPDRLVALRREERDSARQLKQARAALAARAQEVSYRSLYQSVAALEASQPDRCPACETPLGQVAVNPFARATAGIQALRELAELEGEANRLERQVDRQQGQIEAAIHQAVAHAGTLPESERLAPMDQALGTYGSREWRRLLVAARALQKRDDGLAAERIEREAMDAEAERLRAARTRLADIEGQQRQFDADVVAARERVAAFDAQTAPLVAEVAAEAADHQVEVRIKRAYEAFYASLKEYLASLPERLMADLNEVVVDLYNGFNVQDHPGDLIHELRLPLIGGKPMEVCFKGAPDRWHNALALLSEGHLRCLGLAILLAKNIKLGLPVVLLDDAVNAIDHDHREGIRSTLFGHPELIKKQMIITCHSDEFIKDIHNKHAPKAELYVLRHHDGEHHPLVSGGNTRNYLIQASACFADYNLRGALAHSRQALEGLVTQVWKKLIKDAPQLAVLPLRLRGPGAAPDLRNVAETLLSVIGKAVGAGTLKDDPWRARYGALEAILTAKINSQAWLSLNKGTHEEEDREDFEAPTVKRVVEALHDLDATFA
jgi:energy-coupling factor transporter ATP-binding protein EcfA2